MNVRVLVLSDTRPSRTRRIAERISGESPDFEICGVVQHALRKLSPIQQVIARGDIDSIGSEGHVSSKTVTWVRQMLCEIVHGVLWFAHGCPRGVRANLSFTVRDLAALCHQSGWRFLHAAQLSGEDVIEFVRRQRPNLIVVLGEPLLRQELLDIPSLGLARTLVNDSDSAKASLHESIELKVEYLARGSGRSCALASLTIPPHHHDGPLGKTLKSDLIADDLLVQAAKALGKGIHGQASKEVEEWVHRNLSPYLDQSGPPSPQKASFPRRHRSILKLGVQSFLCLLWVMSRNWYRRVRSRYPVLILSHHLASDRPHRMGIPTADLWHRIRFLQSQYQIVSLSEASKRLRSGTVTVPTVVLTFDDGYCDNYVTLRALAEETRAKIVLFLATRQIELHQEFDHDVIAGTRGFFPLTWDQVEDWSQRDIEFGSHTRTHFDCGSNDGARLEWEIVGSGRDLEVHLDRPCRFFAFPFGKHENMSAEAMQIAASNYSIFLSSYGGENLPCKGRAQQHLLRKGFSYDPWELELEMQSVFDLLQSARLTLQRWLGPFRLNRETASSRRWPWTVLHACLLVLALLPPFRRLLNSGDL